MSVEIIHGDALDMLRRIGPVDLIATDPPYAFGGAGDEHVLTATVAIVLREAARKLKPGGWLLVFAASSWRSTAYMVEAVRGVVEPVRIAPWHKPEARGKTKTPGWRWQTVNVIAFRNGKSAPLEPFDGPDFIVAPPIRKGRRAELPPQVATWAVAPFVVAGGVSLDPFSGSGALPRACAELGMRAIGIEKSPQAQGLLADHALNCDLDEDCGGCESGAAA